MRLARKKWADKNKGYHKEYVEKNREHINALYRTYYANNKDRLIPYINAHRRGRISDATPAWADKPAIRQFYVNCPPGHHVDHIIPIHGRKVSGLHVLENLQYLPAAENLRKSNKCPI